MKKCPNCGKKLHIYNVSQFCPACGTNMRFYGFAENFYREAKLAELSQAGIHVKVRRLKAAFIGTKLSIIRLVTMILPVAALLVPSGSFTLNLPYKSSDFQFGLMGIYGMITGGDLNFFISMKNSVICGEAFSALLTALAVYLSVAVLGIICLFTCILCFISYKNMQKITSVFAALGIIDTFVAMKFISSFAKVSASCPVLTAKTGLGLLACTAGFIIVLVVNILLSVKGIPVKYEEGMEERVAIYKQVKAGKVSLEDLPQPVVQTEKTRIIDAEIAKEEKNIEMNKPQGDDSGDKTEQNDTPDEAKDGKEATDSGNE